MEKSLINMKKDVNNLMTAQTVYFILYRTNREHVKSKTITLGVQAVVLPCRAKQIYWSRDYYKHSCTIPRELNATCSDACM